MPPSSRAVAALIALAISASVFAADQPAASAERQDGPSQAGPTTPTPVAKASVDAIVRDYMRIDRVPVPTPAGPFVCLGLEDHNHLDGLFTELARRGGWRGE